MTRCGRGDIDNGYPWPWPIEGDEPPADLVADAADMLRTLFSVERIAEALHQRMLEAAATEHYYPDTIEAVDRCHIEEAEDLRERVLRLAGSAVLA